MLDMTQLYSEGFREQPKHTKEELEKHFRYLYKIGIITKEELDEELSE